MLELSKLWPNPRGDLCSPIFVIPAPLHSICLSSGPVAHYCNQCVDEDGNLKPYEEIYAGVVEWLKTWQPNLDDAKAKDAPPFI